MNTRKFLPFFVLVLIAAFALVSCGGGESPAEPEVAQPAADTSDVATDDTAETDAAEEEMVEEEPAEEAAEPELTLTIWTDEKQFEVISGMTDEFREAYGVNLVVEQFGFGDMQQQFLIAAPAGEGPDVMATAHSTLGEVVTNGLIVPIDLGDDVENYNPAAIQAWIYNGELYGLPQSTENVGFFINTDIVAECPVTWTEVQEISRTLSANNDDDFESNRYGFVRGEGDPYHFFPIQTAFGGYIFGLTDQGYDPSDVGLDSEGSLAAAEFWDNYIKEGLQPEGVDGQVMMDMFESGQSAMTITGPWNTQRVLDSGTNFDICPIPGEVAEFGQPFMGSFGFVISAFSENPLLADIFVKEFLNREETMQAFYDLTPQVPAHLGVLDKLDDENLASYGAAGLNALAMPAIPEMGSVWEAWGNAVTLISQQADDPSNAFSNAADQVRTAIAAEPIDPATVEIETVNIPGSAQDEIGCDGEWDPACEATMLTLGDDGLWSGTFDIPAGDHLLKVTINGGWDINYGANGAFNGDNIEYTLDADSTVTFTFDPETNILDIATE